MDKLRRVQADLQTPTIDFLRDTAHVWRKEMGYERIGIGTIVAELLDALVAARPEIRSELLESAERTFMGSLKAPKGPGDGA